MNERVYQILYCSRNTMQGTDAEVRVEIEKILRASRVNNARAAVTGALFYNKVFFAQVLEGTFGQVQRVFERLQLDPRHSDLVVLQSGFVSRRDFGDWSMAFAGTNAEVDFPLSATGQSRAAASACGLQVLSFLREVVIKQEAWALPQRVSSVRSKLQEVAVLS
ncbi:MAG TPA: BLUF domain-containing protein [Acidobacteriaceae bacterium]|nr:BLUF domain-containing protein [Acidobacteriaceae bacterium]